MNNNLENQAPADTFKSLLQTGNNAGVQGTITTIQDGAGVDTALAISSNAARVNGAFAVTGNLDVAGDFTVNGTTTTINTETLNIEDETLVIASNVDHTQLVQPSGILWGNNANPPQLTYQEGIGFNFSGGDLLKDGNLYGISQLAVTTAGGAFSIDGESRKTLNLQRGLTYRFDQSNATNANHPLKFSEVSDGTHTTPGSEYTVGVITVGTPGQTGAYTQITLTPSTPNLYYYCGNHSGMGGDALGSITIEAGGNVGIGAATPAGLLHLKGDTNDNGAELFLQINNNNTTDNIGTIHFGNNVDSTLSRILSGTSGANNSSYLTLSTSKEGTVAERMRIDSDGKVGIGTTSPDEKLHIEDGFLQLSRTIQTNNIIRFEEAGTTSFNIGTDVRENGFFIAGSSFTNNRFFTVTSDGDVGIGTTTPSAKVDARGLVSATNGMVRATGWFTGDSALHGLGCEIGISAFGGVDTGYLMTYNRSENQYGNTMIQSNNAMLKVVGVGETTVELNGNTVRMRRIVEGGFSETAVQIDGTLEVSSTTGGVVLPRMTNAQMTAISATPGEMVFNTTDSKFYGYNGTSWVALH